MTTSTVKKRQEEHRINQFIAQRLRLRRHEIGISEADTARLLRITVGQYRKHESGSVRIPLGRLCLLARSMHVPVGWFFDGL